MQITFQWIRVNELDISWRSLRSRILTPNVSETLMDVRGFHVKDADGQALLEMVGRVFLTGYAAATEVRAVADVEPRLDRTPTRFRGFAYEGAAMGFAVLDGLPAGGNRRLGAFLTGPGRPHVYMVYVGIGWALARLPGFRWSKVRAPDPLLRWLVLDGYGFHQAYFKTSRYVDGHFRDPVLRWPTRGRSPYARRAVDQGIGRALWFVCGADPELALSKVEEYAPDRRADLYSGLGLAITYAGGAEEKDLLRFWERAGDHRPFVAQGCAFGAEARLRADLVVPHVELATEVFCGMTPQQASHVCAEQLPVEPIDIDTDVLELEPGYEKWRQRIAGVFASTGRR